MCEVSSWAKTNFGDSAVANLSTPSAAFRFYTKI
jgi:hypothetical protein